VPAAATTDEFWTFTPPGGSATTLNFPYWNVATLGGSRLALPPKRGDDVQVAYRTGRRFKPKLPDSRVLTLVMWAAGIDQNTGVPAADQRLAFNDNLRTLRSLFWTTGSAGSVQGTLTRRWYITQSGSPGIVAASALAEVASTMDPAMTGRFRADFSVDFLLADPYFYGSQQTQTLAYNTAAAVSNLGDEYLGLAFGQPFTLKLNGPLTNPVVTNTTLGVSVSLYYTIASGHYVTLDVLNYTAYDDTGISRAGLVAHAGARPWMVIAPSAVAGSNSLKLTSTSGTDTGTCLLTWSPAYV
jgi:hypothetical protein